MGFFDNTLCLRYVVHTILQNSHILNCFSHFIINVQLIVPAFGALFLLLHFCYFVV